MRKITVSVLFSLAVVLAIPVMAQQQESHPSTPNPLLQLLQSKGILSADEVSSINHASSADDANARLGRLLVSKGLISDQEYKTTFASPATVSVATPAASEAHLMEAVYHTPMVKAEPGPPAAL